MPIIRRAITALSIVGALAIGGAVGVAVVDHGTNLYQPESVGLPPCTDYVADHGGECMGPLLPECESEDSDNCAWDAQRMGNGIGRSFYVIDGNVTYTTR